MKEALGFYFMFLIFLLFFPKIANLAVVFFVYRAVKQFQSSVIVLHIFCSIYHTCIGLDIPWKAKLLLIYFYCSFISAFSSLKSSDKCGKLPLSPKQKAMFAKWVRPDDITNNPTMIYTVSSFSIKQVNCS